ncbi:unnamed protein product [Durusdinium trenchii]|uniref:Uncharacterized protein n=1 Tax=Durusdinium trenchii TaxID=1381693 RepID=A0ABP0PN35_9DINO
MDEKIKLGNPRMKKRSKKVDKTQSNKYKVAIPGMFVDLDVYKADFGDPADRNHEVHDILDPATNQKVKAVFMPKRKAGYYEGEISLSNKVQKSETLDDDARALRNGQVDQSYCLHQQSFAKDLPKPLKDAQTFSESSRPLPQPEQPDHDQETSAMNHLSEVEEAECKTELDDSEFIELAVAMQSREDSEAVEGGAAATSVMNKTKDMSWGTDEAANTETKNLIQDASRAIFLAPAERLQSKQDPDEKVAFGAFNDFFWFTKTDFGDQVSQLQPKLLGTALSNILSIGGTDDYQLLTSDLVSLLLLFLPSETEIDKSVICKHAASVLVTLSQLAVSVQNMLQTNQSPDPEECDRLSSQVDLLKAGNISKRSKPLTRLATTGGFKKIVLYVQSQISRCKQDHAAGKQAASLQAVHQEISKILSGKTKVSSNLMGMVAGCHKLKTLIELIAALPLNPDSQYVDLRSNSISLRDDLED